jgi:DNA-binding transcriptional LysR family regulator
MLDSWKYSHVVTFVYAADKGLHYAARCLERPLADISTDLHRLEFLGGERLFHINEDRLVLTREGEVFFRELKPLLEQIDSIYQNIASRRVMLINGMYSTANQADKPANPTQAKPTLTKISKPWWKFW